MADRYVSCHSSGVGSCLIFLARSRLCIGETHRSPRKSTMYASTPPGIDTSTRISSREKALKQQYVPLRTRHELALPPNHAVVSSIENWSELRYAASDAEDEASTPELR